MRSLALYAATWFLAGFAIASLINTWFGSLFEPYQGGLAGLIVGLIIVTPIIRTRRGRRLFYEGPAEGEAGDPLIGCVFLLPIFMLIMVAIAWLVAEAWPIK